ncbi:hypothetical protein [Breoghania sp. L-A4]|uniref:hypothetical protein n=1 Tax=Breoghania sp. L-A4 TaxID=2304600 RepID=UPI0013C315A4|nr:hypothetical protein [Breoghania sp. L-A4]
MKDGTFNVTAARADAVIRKCFDFVTIEGTKTGLSAHAPAESANKGIVIPRGKLVSLNFTLGEIFQ